MTVASRVDICDRDLSVDKVLSTGLTTVNGRCVRINCICCNRHFTLIAVKRYL